MDQGLTGTNALRARVAKVKNQGVTETRKTPGSWLRGALRPVSGPLQPRLPGIPRALMPAGASATPG